MAVNLIRKYGNNLSNAIANFLFSTEIEEDKKKVNDFIAEVSVGAQVKPKNQNIPVNAVKCGAGILRGERDKSDPMHILFCPEDYRDRFNELHKARTAMERKIQETLVFLHPALYRGDSVQDIYEITPDPLHPVIKEVTGVSFGESEQTFSDEEVAKYTAGFEKYLDKVKVQLVYRFIDGE